MAQQTDPNAPPGNDTARAASGGGGAIAAGSADTYRAPGFKSPALSTTGNNLSGITAAPGAPVAPTTTVWGKYSGALTPGIQAAMAAGGSGQPGAPNSQSFGQAAKNSLLDPTTPFGLGGSLLGLNGLFGKGPNNSQLQDIGGALYQGLPISDADWANAGYGPGGATLAAPAATTGLRSVATAPVTGMTSAAINAAQQKQPVGTIPTNAVLKY